MVVHMGIGNANVCLAKSQGVWCVKKMFQGLMAEKV